MPTFKITGPDGAQYNVTGDNAEGALAALQTHLGGSASQPSEAAMRSPLENKAAENGGLQGGIAATTGFLNGIPIVGPALQSGVNAASAGIGSLISGEPYSDVQKETSGITNAAQEAHPYITTGGRVAGAITGTLPMMAAAPEAFGIGGEPLLLRAITGSATGGALGSADAAVRGQDPLKGGMWGAAGGFAGPVAGEALAGGANAVSDALTSLSPKAAAAKNLTDALLKSGSSPDEVMSSMAGTPLTGMDVNPVLQQMGQKLVVQGGAPRAILSDMVANRTANAPGAVEGIYDAAMGPTPNVKAYLDNLKATTQANAKAGFDSALQNAGPVNVNPVLEHIDNAVTPGVQPVSAQEGINSTFLSPQQQALLRVRSQLANDYGTLTDANKLHQIQSGLRTEANALSSSANGSERLTGKALGDVRQKIIDQIDQASGGKFRPAQQQYADDMAIQNAFDKGRTIFNNGTSSDAALLNRPEYWQDWASHASQPEIEAAKLGARVAADNTMQSVRNAAAKGEAIPEAGFNRDRLEILFGKPETDKMVSALQQQKSIAQTNAKLTAGSETGNRVAYDQYTNVPHTTSFHGLGGIAGGILAGHEVGGIPGAILGATGMPLLNAVRGGLATARNVHMAKALSGGVQALQDALAATPASNLLSGPKTQALVNALVQAPRQQLMQQYQR